MENLRHVLDIEDQSDGESDGESDNEEQELAFDALPDDSVEIEDEAANEGDSQADGQYRADAEEVWRVVTAQQSIKISRWEQFGTVKSIGGVHSGKIILFLVENEEGERILVDGNTKYGYGGGQTYIPMSKKIIHDQDFLKSRVIPTLPAILMNLFANQRGMGAETLSSMSQSAVLGVKKLRDFYDHAFNELLSRHMGNCIRYEMFSPIDPEDEESFSEDEQEYVQSWVVSRHLHLSQQYALTLQEVIAPLYSVFVEKGWTTEVWRLSGPVKAMLLFCAEMAVKLAGFHPFEGRLMKQLTPTAAHDGRVHYWKIPRENLVEISKTEYELTGLPCGLNTDLLEIPLDTSVARPNEADRKRDYMKLPIYVQMYQRVLDIGVNHPARFLSLHMKLCSLVWDAIDRRNRPYAYLDEYRKQQELVRIGLGAYEMGSNPPDYHPPKRSIFQKPEFKELASCTAQQLGMLMEAFAKVIALAYDYEWFVIYQQAIWKYNKKLKKGSYPRFKLAEFPTTEEGLEAFLLKLNRRRTGRDAVEYMTRRSATESKNIGDVISKVDDFMRYICYSMQLERSCKAWNRSLTWNLLRNVKSMRDEAAKALPALQYKPKNQARAALEGAINQPQTKADILGDENFKRVLLQVFQSEYRTGRACPQDTHAIVWHSNNRQYQKADETKNGIFAFQPMYIEIKQGPRPNTRNETTLLLQQQHMSAELPRAQEFYPYANRNVAVKERNELFLESRKKLDILAIIRLRVLFYYFAVHGGLPPLKHIFPLIECIMLTSSTKMSDFCIDSEKNKFGFRKVRNRIEKRLPLEGEWNHWKLNVYDKLERSNKSSGDAVYDLAKAAMHNFSSWNLTNLEPCSMFYYTDPTLFQQKQSADAMLTGSGVRKAMSIHGILGVITPDFLDALKNSWHELCEQAEETTSGKRKREDDNEDNNNNV